MMIKRPLPCYVEEANNIPGFVMVADGLCGMQIEPQPPIFILDPVPPPRVRTPLDDDARGSGTRRRAPSVVPNLQRPLGKRGEGWWGNHLPLVFLGGSS